MNLALHKLDEFTITSARCACRIFGAKVHSELLKKTFLWARRKLPQKKFHCLTFSVPF